MSEKDKINSASNRPLPEQLLVHPILPEDNGTAPEGYSLPPDMLTKIAALPISPVNHPGLLRVHAHTARFYAGNLTKAWSLVGEFQVNYYHQFAKSAFEIATHGEWSGTIQAKRGKPSYSTFCAVMYGGPSHFNNVAQIMLACEQALDVTIGRGKYSGKATDVYDIIKIVPACYFISGLNQEKLQTLRKQIDDFDYLVLDKTGQHNPSLLDEMATGHGVTRITARAIRWNLIQILHSLGRDDDARSIANVTAKPPKGPHLRSAKSEDVNLYDLSVHLDRPSQQPGVDRSEKAEL